MQRGRGRGWGRGRGRDGVWQGDQAFSGPSSMMAGGPVYGGQHVVPHHQGPLMGGPGMNMMSGGQDMHVQMVAGGMMAGQGQAAMRMMGTPAMMMQQQQQGGMMQGGGDFVAHGRNMQPPPPPPTAAAEAATGYPEPWSGSVPPDHHHHRPPPPKRSVSRGGAGNDYCQHFVNTGVRPQNFLRDSVLEDRCQDYPDLQRLTQMKDEQVARYNTPMYGLRADLRKLKLHKELFGTKFDVILIDPPWEQYVRRAPHFVEPGAESWSWEEIRDLAIEEVADTPSFVFLWCGSAEGLDAGRHCLKKWGFRRVEDICWIKTNKDHGRRKYLTPVNQEPGSMLVHTKEHCLVGMRGNIKRSIDGHMIHTNIDTDVIVSEEPPLGSTEKPRELYEIIERFCAGRRRLELFGEDHNLREGWVTVGKSISQTTFRRQVYINHFRNADGIPYDEHRGGKPPPGAPVLVPSTADIEALRPRSPPPQHGGGRGRGRGNVFSG